MAQWIAFLPFEPWVSSSSPGRGYEYIDWMSYNIDSCASLNKKTCSDINSVNYSVNRGRQSNFDREMGRG